MERRWLLDGMRPLLVKHRTKTILQRAIIAIRAILIRALVQVLLAVIGKSGLVSLLN
jgi:hypothetical protein